MHGYPVTTFCGKGYVEVKRRDVDKGVAVTRILEALRQQQEKPIEFVLCIGDDLSDEDMFEAVGKLFSRRVPPQSPNPGFGDQAKGNERAAWLRRRSSSKEPAATVKVTTEVRSSNSRSSLSDATPTSLSGRSQAEGDGTCTYTVTVGRKASQAQYFVQDVGEVSQLLKLLSAQTVISSFSRFASLPNLLKEEDAASSEDGLGEEMGGRASNFVRMPSDR
uniref:Trehalose 6-phosphate phosphatase n=1 Tax=Pyrodinium bahamense TaxID=73915 RepID=A0A7R9ZYY8_9DINO